MSTNSPTLYLRKGWFKAICELEARPEKERQIPRSLKIGLV
jgi:hypothetical protein